MTSHYYEKIDPFHANRLLRYGHQIPDNYQHQPTAWRHLWMSPDNSSIFQIKEFILSQIDPDSNLFNLFAPSATNLQRIEFLKLFFQIIKFTHVVWSNGKSRSEFINSLFKIKSSKRSVIGWRSTFIWWHRIDKTAIWRIFWDSKLIKELKNFAWRKREKKF